MELKVRRTQLQQELAKDKAVEASTIQPSAPPKSSLYPAPLAVSAASEDGEAAVIRAKIREKQATLRMMQEQLGLPASDLAPLRAEIDRLQRHPSLRSVSGSSFSTGIGSVGAISVEGISFSSLSDRRISEGTPPTLDGNCRASV